MTCTECAQKQSMIQLMINFFPYILSQSNSFQLVLTSSNIVSYAIFTYKCGSLNWKVSGAGIGFSASEEFFANHPLSRSNDVNDIACLNEPYSQWSNVIYNLTKCKSL